VFALFKRKKAESGRAAGVYQHTDVLIVHALRQARAGFRVAVPPALRLPPSSPAAEVGKALRAALSAFQADGEDPSDWNAFRSEFLHATGFRSWKALEEGARSCWIEEEAAAIRLTPLKNGGSRGAQRGFQPFGVAPSTVSASAGDEEIGRALLEALSRSE
jgi:hypothetical protein